MFGVDGASGGSRTVCGSSDVLDDSWHHVEVARRRSDGHMWLFVDGSLEAQADGPDGDVSYPDDGYPLNRCGGPCLNSDPFIVLAAEKHDAGAAYPSFSGWMDELRISNTLRHTTGFTPPSAGYGPDANTVLLFHFDEGSGTQATDSSKRGPSHGEVKIGGNPSGPIWVPSAAPALAP